MSANNRLIQKSIFHMITCLAVVGLALFNTWSGSTIAVAPTHHAAYDIGMVFPSLDAGTRWPREEAYIRQILEKKGFLVDSRASGDQTIQNTLIAELVSEGVKVLIVVPKDRQGVISAVESATQAGVKVIAYDRLIPTTQIAAYLSFSSVEIGKKQGVGILKALDIENWNVNEKGPVKLVKLGGSPNDNNAILFRKGQDEVIDPYVASGKVSIVADQWVTNWDPTTAYTMMQEILADQSNQIDAVLASNDGTALGALNALAEQGLAGVVPISGQDATIDGCKSIIKGDLTLSILKDIRIMALRVAYLSEKLYSGESDPTLMPYDLASLTGDPSINGSVPAYFAPVQTVNEGNLINLVVKSGLHSYDDVYADTPVEQRPPRPTMAITDVFPNAGPETGNDVIALTGLSFSDGATVKIGNVNATSVTVVDQSILIAITGAHPAGLAELMVTNPDTTSTTLPDAYRFLAVEQATITYDAGGELVTNDNMETSINVPPHAVDANTTLIYTAAEPPPYEPTGFSFAGHAFTLAAYQNDVPIHPFVFDQPVTVTIHYSDNDVADLDESMLALNYWTGSEWADAACGGYDRHISENWLSVPICHLSHFAFFQSAHGIYLPEIQK